MNRARTGGWTIIELTVVLTVFSMMMAYGMPFAGTILANGKVRSAAEGLQDGIAIAQAEALRRSTNVELVLVTGEPAATNAAASAAAIAPNWLVRVPADATRGITSVGFVRGSPSATPTGAASIENRGGSIGVGFTSSGRLAQSSGGVISVATTPLVFRVTAVGADRPLCVYSTISGSVKTCDPQLASTDFRACAPALAAGVCPAPVAGGGP